MYIIVIMKNVLKKIKDAYKRIKPDKKKHYVAGFIITIVTGLLAGFLISPLVGLLIGFFTGVVVGAAKELIWDLALKKGNVEFKDFLFTAYGSATATVVLLIVFLIVVL